MNWIVLRSLNELYIRGKVPVKVALAKDPQVQHLLNHTKELCEFSALYIKGDGFDEYYERTHRENYRRYLDFLRRNDFLKPQLRFEEADIRILMEIEKNMHNGNLLEIREQIIAAQESVRGVSLMFFKNEKYLPGKEALTNAVKYLLDIEELADDRDQQYRYVLDCENPKLIVLCENLDFLKRPNIPRTHQIELWYAGGKNIAKLDYVTTRGLPIYYSCDWDYDGLKIFEAVKKKIPEIAMLYPNGEPRSIEKTEHKSLWKRVDDLDYLSGIDKSLFDKREIELIQSLIESNQWIIEESNGLLGMVNKCFPIADENKEETT